MLLLLLAACGYPSYYPSTSYWGVFDTGGDTDTSVPCGDAWSFDVIAVTVVSNVDTELALYSVDPDCVERPIGSLPPRGRTDLSGNPGNVFLARSAGEVYAWHQVPYELAGTTWSIW